MCVTYAITVAASITRASELLRQLELKYNASPSARRMKAIGFLGKMPYHLADVFRFMGLGLVAQTPGVVIKLALGHIEGVAQRDIHTLVVVAIRNDSGSRHAFAYCQKCRLVLPASARRRS